jgi:hypothetical protein
MTRASRSATLVLRVLPLAAAAARGQAVVGVVEVNGPSAVCAAVASDPWLFSDVISHSSHPP